MREWKRRETWRSQDFGFQDVMQDVFTMPSKDLLMKWKSLAIAALLLPASLVGHGAAAAGYPEKMITIVVPYPAGSTADAIPRLVAPLLQKSLGVNVIIEN